MPDKKQPQFLVNIVFIIICLAMLLTFAFIFVAGPILLIWADNKDLRTYYWHLWFSAWIINIAGEYVTTKMQKVYRFE